MYGIPYAAVKLSLSLQKQIGVFLNCLFYFFAVHSIGHCDPKSFWGDNFPFSETTYCEKPVDEVILKDNCGEGLFKMPSVPKKTPEKKGRAKDEEKDGNVEGDQKGKKVRTQRHLSLSLYLYFSF